MKIEYNLTVSDVEQHAEALVDFHAQFADFFRTTTRSVAPHALDYLRGQLLCETRRTMARMSVTVVERDKQALSNFISMFCRPRLGRQQSRHAPHAGHGRPLAARGRGGRAFVAEHPTVVAGR